MKAVNIPAQEQSFRAAGVDSQGKKFEIKPLNVAIPDSTERISMMECTQANGDESFFYKEEVNKKRIVLHFTQGYLKGDVSTLTKPNYHVSVPFLVARDGTIYNLWTSKYWSYHLKAGENLEKSSVGIEISNIGYLIEKDGNFQTSYGDIYCAKSETDFYSEVSAFRGHRYFGTFTNEQYTSIISLLRFLTARYDIPRDFVESAQRYDVLHKVGSFNGITSHVNYRSDGKWDIGPAFDWNRVISGVTE